MPDGEVSLVNDDNTDNCFTEPLGRFPTVEEDETPSHLLVNDYDCFVIGCTATCPNTPDIFKWQPM